MTTDAKLEALTAIQDEVLKLFGQNLPRPVMERLKLIESIARYGIDVRTEEERARK